MPRERLDRLVVKHGLSPSREQAQRLIGAGEVLVNGHPATKAGHQYPDDVTVEVKARPRFVSRGGEKLEAAFEAFPISVEGLICMDIGASTGGFTDCMLQHGARRVYAIDVGKGQLAWTLRNDERVVVLEKVNARNLTPDQIADTPLFASVDVSFISLTLILPAAIGVLGRPARMVTLIKPQFEAGREQVGKGGVVRDPLVHEDVIARIRAFGENVLGLRWQGFCESPVRGPAGNVEFLAHWIVEGGT